MIDVSCEIETKMMQVNRVRSIYPVLRCEMALDPSPRKTMIIVANAQLSPITWESGTWSENRPTVTLHRYDLRSLGSAVQPDVNLHGVVRMGQVVPTKWSRDELNRAEMRGLKLAELG
ncbi:uncharacterized protein N7483_012357 [Penicillium malachiteum]|uniref:uncharacterized protein n=1 Tax=Penicillium malachiteum TaxID=1324776 RepID=UPI002548B61F|nr:uncharacterized protein N7483_012357 [Penicillium malachiteum]KAJ5715176.1 hypothetical protein N7483_012357 [Penicillium malachiteum]